MNMIFVDSPLTRLQRKHSELHEEMLSFMRDRDWKMVEELKKEAQTIANQICSIVYRS